MTVGAAARQPLIRMAGITKRFGDVVAVDDVSLDIGDGEFVCLLGPSGCGKSTLLRLLAGLESLDAGRIELDGRDITGDPPHRRPLNMMFQSYALFPHMSVARNVAYGLRWSGLSRKAIAARVDEMLALVRLEGYGDRSPAQISGGQRQRVALARALARQPRMLLLDEPLGALDRRLRAETQAELKTLQARLGTTFVVVTHDQEEAMILGDRIGVMDRGRILQLDTPATVYERPADRFVAGFMGEMNLIDGVVVGAGAGLRRIATALSPEPLVAEERDEARWRPGRTVALAIRPAAIRLGGSDASGPNILAGRVAGCDFVSGVTHLRVEVGGRSLRVTTLDRGAAPGEPATLVLPPGAAVLLD